MTEHREFHHVPGAERALTFAGDAYRTRSRRPGRTVGHPIAVGRLLADDGQPALVVIAGILHDVLEDTDASEGELEDAFGSELARLVGALTQDPAIDNYRDRKAALRRQIVDAGQDAATVSLADKLAKLQSRRGPPAERKLDHYQRTLHAVEARYGTSRLSALLREQLDRWSER